MSGEVKKKAKKRVGGGMDLSNVSVAIESAKGVGGVFPFVVACFDNEVSREVYKTSATTGGERCEWNETFEVNLRAEEKERVTEGRPPPLYLTFFLYDTGTAGVPALGSAGVLLDTVREQGVAQGDFPIVNGKGTLSLVVDATKRSWLRTNAAKTAGIAGAVGAGALAAGFTAHAIGKRRKKKRNEEQAAAAAAAAHVEDGDPGDEDDAPDVVHGYNDLAHRDHDDDGDVEENAHLAPASAPAHN